MTDTRNASPEQAIDLYFDMMPQLTASDLHMKVGSPILLRIGGQLRPLDMPPITLKQAASIVDRLINAEQRKQLEACGSVDLAHITEKECRVRINIFMQRGLLSMAARYVHQIIPTFEELTLPAAALKKIATNEAGLVVIAGPTGSGKSTTIASIIDYINHTRKCHIITIEDPIEFLHTDDKALISQREIGMDSDTFANALKFAMRQDPDIIMLGEMRDAETVQTGLTAAETGHLVFGTLHAASAPQAISRMLDLFPGERHEQLRKGLVFNLRAIVCQKLLRAAGKDRKRVPATEIMLCTPPIKQLLDDGEDGHLHDVIIKSREEGMVDFTQSLFELVQRGLVTKTEALAHAPNSDALRAAFDGLTFQK